MIMKRKIRLTLLVFMCMPFVCVWIYAQEIPLVYEVENTGSGFPKPVLPAYEELPVVEPLPDPFEWSDGSSRDTTFESWSHRRSEIKAEIEHYEIGIKPDRPDTLDAVLSGDTALIVTVIENGDTLVLHAPVSLPEGEGPFPAVIALDFLTLPSSIFTSRNIAIIYFSSAQVMAHTQTRGNEPINKLYPDLTYMGAYSAWSWGVSRLIDGLELVRDSSAFDLAHLAVTGCSYAGKMALFAGAFDERIALTIAQEPGGGGAAAWRVSETLGNVETLGATSRAWFIEDMFRFSGSNVSKLPHDHHELIAMVAPRAFLMLGNPDMTWLAEESGYVSCRAAHEVWEAFGIGDRMGFSIVGGHGHCQLPASQYPEVEAFVDKFLLGDTAAHTNVAKNPFEFVDDSRWFEWWGTGNPEFPDRETGNAVTKTFEAECAVVGSDWEIKRNAGASNGAYITVKPGTQSLNNAPVGSESHMTVTFTIDSTGNYTVFARINCPTPDDDSYWVKMDNGSFQMFNGLGTSGWQWKNFGTSVLEEGPHTLTVAYREDGALLDKISISSILYAPTEMGEDAENICDINVGVGSPGTTGSYSLGQNVPNPAIGNTMISFEFPENTYASLKIYNLQGEEMAELAGKEFIKGKHTLGYDVGDLSNGIYFYSIKTNRFTDTRRMIILD